jgi:hypothetical protein
LFYLLFMGLMALITGLYGFLLVRRSFRAFGLLPKYLWLKYLALAMGVLVGLLCANIWSTSAMVVLHILVMALLLDLFSAILRKLFQHRGKGKAWACLEWVHRSGFGALALAALLLGYGAWNFTQVGRTEYTVTTEKDIGNYTVVLITDTHYGTIQDPAILQGKLEEINNEQPDVIILGGDLVEEGTSKAAMQEIFHTLGTLDTTYGIYYVYGNHDRQPYTNSRTYTDRELVEAITESGITILEDDYWLLGSDLIIAGRGDAAWGGTSGRVSTKTLLQGADRERFILLADHQPIGAKENSDQGVDLEVSGHTHAGQIWPVGLLMELFGGLNYGYYQVENCQTIVSSGFTGWGYPIRTEGHSEYVVIHITKA